jgi:hypothetical protein
LVIIFLHNIIPIGGVVLIGGQSGNLILDTIYKLTSISGTWTDIDSKLKIPRRNFALWKISSHLISDCSLGEIFLIIFLTAVSLHPILKQTQTAEINFFKRKITRISGITFCLHIIHFTLFSSN